MKLHLILFVCAVLLSSLALPRSSSAQDAETMLHEATPPGPGDALPLLPPVPGEAGNFLFISSEFDLEKLVKGAPYSGQAITERVQELADGNRITQQNTANIFRDSDGRTRREQELSLIGPWSASSEQPAHTVFIHDPVSGTDYILNDKDKTARKVKMRLELKQLQPGSDKEAQHFKTWTDAVPPPPGGPGERHMFRFYKEQMDAKTESLGKQMIEGIAVEGTRTTSTIPAGKIGNDRPIQIVSENWYSPELQVNVLTRHNDPRFGETTYRLTNISRREPDPSLFLVPAEYKITDSLYPGKIMMRKEKQD